MLPPSILKTEPGALIWKGGTVVDVEPETGNIKLPPSIVKFDRIFGLVEKYRPATRVVPPEISTFPPFDSMFLSAALPMLRVPLLLVRFPLRKMPPLKFAVAFALFMMKPAERGIEASPV